MYHSGFFFNLAHECRIRIQKIKICWWEGFEKIEFFSLFLIRKRLSSGQKWLLKPYFPQIRGIFVLRSGPRFSFQSLEVPEQRVGIRSKMAYFSQSMFLQPVFTYATSGGTLWFKQFCCFDRKLCILGKVANLNFLVAALCNFIFIIYFFLLHILYSHDSFAVFFVLPCDV